MEISDLALPIFDFKAWWRDFLVVLVASESAIMLGEAGVIHYTEKEARENSSAPS